RSSAGCSGTWRTATAGRPSAPPRSRRPLELGPRPRASRSEGYYPGRAATREFKGSDPVSSGCERDPGEQAVGVQQDRQALVELGHAVDVVGVGAADRLDLVGGDRQHLLDAVDDHAGGAALGLDDGDLGAVGVLMPEAEAHGQVADGDDLAAQVDDAADPRGRRRDAARLRVADDLLNPRDRQGVLLAGEGEDDELLGFAHGLIIDAAPARFGAGSTITTFRGWAAYREPVRGRLPGRADRAAPGRSPRRPAPRRRTCCATCAGPSRRR